MELSILESVKMNMKDTAGKYKIDEKGVNLPPWRFLPSSENKGGSNFAAVGAQFMVFC